MEDSSRAPVVKFPKDRSASYHAALFYIVAAREELEFEGIIDLPPLGTPLRLTPPVNLPEHVHDFIRHAWEQTEPLLVNVGETAMTPTHIRHGIAAGWQLVAEDPHLAFSSSEYERWRTIITTRFLPPMLDSRPHWPPPLQTQLNHFGPSWEDVKVSAGWDPVEPVEPLPPAAPLLDDDYCTAYLESLAQYLKHCDAIGARPAQARYKGWAGTELDAGRLHPSVSTLRITFGSWTRALSLAREL